MTGAGAVSLRDGVQIELATGETFVADATEPTGDIIALSHAHGDHLYSRAPADVICSDLTARLATARREDEGSLSRTSHRAVEQVSAGHVPGSRAMIVDDNDGTTYLYFCGCRRTSSTDRVEGGGVSWFYGRTGSCSLNTA